MDAQSKALKRAIQETFRDAETAEKFEGLPQVGDQLVLAIERLIEARVREAISLG